MTNTDPISPLIPAATVILLRDGGLGLETLMLRRNRSLKSFGGAWVFPGGRVDKEDAPHSDELVQAKTASCREAKEETGLSIHVNDLVSLSHWIPPVQEKRRFSTRFFAAKAPDADIEIDHGEIHDFKWVCPKTVIANMPNPDLVIMPPTYVSLHDLSEFNTVDDALSGLAARPDELFETRFKRTDTGFVTYWKPDAGYESGDLSITGPRRRLITGPDGWEYMKAPR